MPESEFSLWMGYLMLKAEESKKEAKKAKNKNKGKRSGGF
tara:strand:- start:3234 stop:3353 length:120 start_codon:yes stop_codon:yes gene_type:complete